jgi:hypothetical protein
MEHAIDDELRNICREIQRDNRTVAEWTEIESCDWFQTAHYCGGFDATEMEFTFSITLDSTECWVLPASAFPPHTALACPPERPTLRVPPSTQRNEHSRQTLHPRTR